MYTFIYTYEYIDIDMKTKIYTLYTYLQMWRFPPGRPLDDQESISSRKDADPLSVTQATVSTKHGGGCVQNRWKHHGIEFIGKFTS